MMALLASKTRARRRARGFTLVELLVTVVIISVISAIAIPSYTRNVQKSHRSTAKGVLLENAQFLERVYTSSLTGTYTGGTARSLVSPKGATGGGIRYNITVNVPTDGASFVLTATPTSPQASDACGTLTLSNTGAQTPTTGNCW